MILLCDHMMLFLVDSLTPSYYERHNPLTSHPETMAVKVVADEVGFGIKLKGLCEL